MRLIDADSLYMNLVKMKDFGELTAKKAIRVVENAPTIKAEPQWIPCSERLPQALEEVFVTSKYGHVYTSRIVHGEFEYGGEVIAWMPLPKPYKRTNMRESE